MTNFTKNLKVTSLISCAIILAGLVVGIFAGGLNVGVDFSGGTLVTINIGADFDMEVVEKALEEANVLKAQAIKTGLTTSTQTMVDIRMPGLNNDHEESEQRINVLASIQKTYPKAEITSVDRVDGVASALLLRNAMFSVLIASALILAYIWVRFELLSGIAAVIALMHDVAIMIAITSILRIPVNSPFIAAVLTIVGYSINNTIVVFDRIRENKKHDTYAQKHLDEITNKSIKESLTRSINTSITTLLTITMVYVFGVESIKEFALPIIIGLLAGTYSSLFIVGPVWSQWSIQRIKKAKQAKRK